MLKFVEYGLFGVSLLIVLALILFAPGSAAPGSADPLPAQAPDSRAQPKLPKH